MKTEKTYNGWHNWETWAAALWIDNDEPNYRMKLRYFKFCQILNKLPSYTGFLEFAHKGTFLVNNDVSWYNSRISRGELTESLRVDYDEWQEYNN